MVVVISKRERKSVNRVRELKKKQKIITDLGVGNDVGESQFFSDKFMISGSISGKLTNQQCRCENLYLYIY